MAVQTRSMVEAEPPAELFNAKDVVTAASLLVLGAAVATLPESAVRRFCGRLGRLHIALRGSRAHELAHVRELADAGLDLRELEARLLTRSYEELAQPLLERRGSGWHPEIILEDREHLDRALDAGRGAVVWVTSSYSGETVLRKALHAAGYPLVDLRTESHPYSGTRLGRRYLNPIRLEVESRYMFHRVVLRSLNDTQALLELKEHLKQNRVVKIMASGNSDKPAEFPLFGGRFSLALGAVALATLSKAPLLPAFMTEKRSDLYVVRIGAPLEAEGRRPGRAAWDAIGRDYVDRLREHVLRNPDQWQGWFARDTWVPPATDAAAAPAPLAAAAAVDGHREPAGTYSS